MTQASTSTRAREGDCWRCAERVGLSAFCLACEAPQPVAPDADHFAVLGLPRQLALDLPDLERRYHEASRRVHPDRHQTGTAHERALSLAASAALNRAYRTLRDPVARGRYWLELHGDAIGSDNNRVPPGLAETVFEVQERLAELRTGGGGAAALQASRADLAARLSTLLEGLDERYRRGDRLDAAPALADLKRTLSEIAYLRTLLRDVDAGLAG